MGVPLTSQWLNNIVGETPTLRGHCQKTTRFQHEDNPPLLPFKSKGGFSSLATAPSCGERETLLKRLILFPQQQRRDFQFHDFIRTFIDSADSDILQMPEGAVEF